MKINHDPATIAEFAEQQLASGTYSQFVREAARTTINQLRAALEQGDTEKAEGLAAWLKENL